MKTPTTYRLIAGMQTSDTLTIDDCYIVPRITGHSLEAMCEFAEAYYDYQTHQIQEGPNGAWWQSFFCGVVTNDNITEAFTEYKKIVGL